MCFRSQKRLVKALPLLVSLILEAIGWLCVFVFPDPSLETAGNVVGIIFLGMYQLGGVSLGWFVYGVIRAVQKFIRN